MCTCLWFASAHESGIQTTCAYRVLVAQPSNEALQAQTVTAQSSFYSVNDRRLHFGLGDSKTADLDIHWTNGGVEKVTGVKARQFIVVKEGQGVIKRETWS